MQQEGEDLKLNTPNMNAIDKFDWANYPKGTVWKKLPTVAFLHHCFWVF